MSKLDLYYSKIKAVDILYQMTAVSITGRGHQSGPYLSGKPVSGMEVIEGDSGEPEIFFNTREQIAASINSGDIITVYMDDDSETYRIFIQ